MPMQTPIFADERGRSASDWLDSRHTFSFGQYYDPRRMGYGPLRVINDDRVAPGGGFATHGHANMEILTWVIDGALAHRDSLGTGSTIRPGDLQRMSAGSGIQHSEFNASQTQPVHFLQIWIQPDRVNGKPSYAQQSFDAASRDGRWCLIASRDGADGSVAVLQDLKLYAADLQAGVRLDRTLDPARGYWLQVVSGAVAAGERTLGAGDALALDGERALNLAASAASQVLLFDLPAVA